MKTFNFDKKHAVKLIAELTSFIDSLDDTKQYQLTLGEAKKKRSLNANSYCWALIEKIAQLQGLTKEEVYKHYIKEVGIYKQAEIDEKAVDTLIHGWGLNGLGWVAEKVDFGKNKGFMLVNLYYGSSVYNTAQMSRLIDAVVQDCKALDIEVMSDRELSLLIDKWGS